MSSPKTAAKVPGLFQAARDSLDFAVIETAGQPLAAALEKILPQFGLPAPRIEMRAIRSEPFETYRQTAAGASGLCRFAMPPLRAGVGAVLPASLIARMADGFYGGAGDIAPQRSGLSGAECRILERAGELLAEAITNAWSQSEAGKASLAAVITDGNDRLFSGAEMVAVQSFVLVNSPYDNVSIDFLYPVAGLRSLAAQPAHSEAARPVEIDSDWQDRLIDAVLQVRLPLRTIFARAELPLADLLDLQPGDMIPICVSETVPVTVGDRRFATGTIGEFNGRASIQIETMQKDSDDDY